jgi:FkbM family methyltransferase
MLGKVLTSKTIRSLVAKMPRGRSRTARLISRRYPREQAFELVGALTKNSMYLDTGDPFQADMAFGGYQPELIKTVFRLARKGDVVLTAGAQLGYVALTIHQAVGPEGKVLAFEADPRMVEKCRRNLDLNQVEDAVKLIPLALGSANGELEMSLASTAGQSSFAIDHHTISKEYVAVRNGDEVLSELGFTHIDGVVLDVEGWEMEILAGLSETLSTHLPRWAIIECWDQALKLAGSSADELVRKLNTLGWSTTAIDGGPIRDGIDIVCSRE